jgi:site-specific recombinase XerD
MQNTELLEKFLYDCELRQLSNRTIQMYRSDVRLFLRTTSNPFTVTKDDLRDFLQLLHNRKSHSTTIRGYFIAINQFYKFLKWEELIDQNLVPGFMERYIPRKVKPTERRLISIYDARTLTGAAREQGIEYLTLITTFAKLGLRAGEFLKMT